MKKRYKILTATIILMVAVSFFIGSFVKYKLVKIISESTKGLYTAKIDKVSFDIFSFTYKISDFELNFDKQKAIDAEIPVLMNIKCPSLSLSGFSFIETFFSNQFDIGSINSKDTIQVAVFYNRIDSTTISKENKKNSISLFNINNIEIPFVLLTSTNLKTDKLIWRSENLSFAGQAISFDLTDMSILGTLQVEMKDNYFASAKQERLIKKIVVNYSDKLFAVELDSLESNEVVKEFENQIDSISPFEYHFKVQKMIVKINDLFLGISSLFSENKSDYVVPQIELVKPIIFIQKKDEMKMKTKKIKHVLTNESLRSLIIKKLLIHNGNIIYNDAEGKNVVTIKNCNSTLEQLQLDSSNENLPFHYSGFLCEASLVKITAGENYQLILNNLKFDNIKKNLSIKELSLMPLLRSDQYFKNEKYQVPYVKVAKAGVDISQLNFNEKDNSFNCKAIVINHPDLAVLKDKSYPWDENKKELLIHELLKKIPFPIKIDSLIVQNGTIAYRELTKNDQFAEITLTSVQVNAFNICNHVSIDQPQLKIILKSKMYSKIDFSATTAYIDFNAGIHTVSGKLGKGDFMLLNKFIDVGYGAKITSGILKSCDFEITFDNNNAVGWVKPIYSDLSIDFTNFRQNKIFSDKTNMLIRTLLSNKQGNSFKNKIINTATKTVVYSENKDDDSARKGIVKFSRKKYKPFLNFWILSPVQGLVDAVTPIKIEFK